MSDQNEYKTIVSVSLKAGGHAEVSFSVPPELEPLVLSVENNRRAMEYYLLARYAFMHQMHSAFMINTFWAAEHLALALLCFKYKTKEDLRALGGYHELTAYWKEAKYIAGVAKASTMSKFDNYIGNVKGYFQERYPIIDERGKLIQASEKARVVFGENSRAAAFGKVYKLDVDELDHFVNFMLHDITWVGGEQSEGPSTYYGSILDSHDNRALYLLNNNYSIIYPNKAYHGELVTSQETENAPR